MNILINKLTDLVEGINIPSTPFNYVIEVEDDLNLFKTITVQEGEIQKTNELGEPLYECEIYRTEINQVLVGRDEVLEDTGFPVMIKKQKENEEGHKLYFEPIYDEEGEIIDYAEVVEAFDEDGTPNEPVIVEVQKTSIKGKPLFYLDIYEDVEVPVFDHLEEVTTPIVDNKELEPIMIPNMVTKYINLLTDFEHFTVQEIVEAKYQNILEESQCDNVIGHMFLDENDLDLEDEKHSANTGINILQLLPKGQAKTKTITLDTPSKEFVLLDLVADEGIEIYLSGKKFVDGKLSLTSPISNCTIKFVNTTDKYKSIKSYAIGY